MKVLYSVSDLPNTPAVYAMFGGKGRGRYVAYVGIADRLKPRVAQHLIRKDSSIATGTSAACLNPEYVTELWWWEHPDFEQRHVLEAAEMVAFEILDPALRSRGAHQRRAIQLHADADFKERMQALFQGEPAGKLVIRTLEDVFERIAELERRVALLEERVA
jgi:hypothetical protein